jgi:hypothetical protein
MQANWNKPAALERGAAAPVMLHLNAAASTGLPIDAAQTIEC